MFRFLAVLAFSAGLMSARAQTGSNASVTAEMTDAAPIAFGWESSQPVIERTCRGINCGMEREFIYSPTVIYTNDPSSPQVLFSCSERLGLGVIMSYEGIDLASLALSDDNRSRRTNPIEGRLIIDGKRQPLAWMVLRREQRVVVPTTEGFALGLLNAMANKKDIELVVPGVARATIASPGYDNTMREFIQSCPELQGN